MRRPICYKGPRDSGRTVITPSIIQEAEREVRLAQSQGLLYSPEEAWAVPGNRKVETLWSIANRIALCNSVDPEDLFAHLEVQFRHFKLHKGWHEPHRNLADDAMI
jgi:hypothetical protein